MDILIKGMEMPKNCAECFAEQRIGSDFGCGIIGFEDGNTTCFASERREDCPLVEVPVHGRLIDADAFKKSLAFAESTAKWAVPALRAVLMVIDEMPTIIPAESEET